MNAVRRIDDETRRVAFPGHFVNGRRTVALRGLSEARQVVPYRQVLVLQDQVAGLVLFVICGREVDRRKPIEADFAVRFRIIDSARLRCRQQILVVRRAVMQRERQPPPEDVEVQPGERRPGEQTEAVLGRTEISRPEQFLVHPGAADPVLVVVQDRRR